VVTMGKARERMAGAQRIRDLRQEDGATRLARLLLTADKINFLVGLAINPAQVADKAGKVPLRRIVIEDLMTDLKARGKIVSVEYF
jgi:archaeosine-15-forming tRNA-guanine transglycosylase